MKTIHHFVAVVIKTPDSDFTVEFPDFPGAVTAGKDLVEAAQMAVECLNLHVEGMLSDPALWMKVPFDTPYNMHLAVLRAKQAHNFDLITAFYVPFFRA